MPANGPAGNPQPQTWLLMDRQQLPGDIRRMMGKATSPLPQQGSKLTQSKSAEQNPWWGSSQESAMDKPLLGQSSVWNLALQNNFL